ncbi:two-component system, chemotaxis family, CheB/CheR fusion protein [Flavobacteriaceae bacterium MAR_2010_188]|nr:two-component system, chemotaxis family, CheB/CheR fusion protein [Flavobacteriaceae bacterium MAR_2010_188]
MPKHSPIFPIVGVGASAGGLDSFKRFIGDIPVDSGMAYVLLQHLDPDHESLLPEILANHTTLAVNEITDGLKIKPNHIYILPENELVTVSDHVLNLSPRKKNEQNLPIDYFFKSLALIHKTLAAGVVLSGTAHDGTLGLKHIKEHGGITFAEDPQTAKWVEMPQNAISSGVVDFVLSPEEIVKKLLKTNIAYQHTLTWDEEKLPKGQEDAFRQILSLMRLRSNVDFNYYKQPTLKRRIARRMGINEMDSLKNYLELLREDKNEQEALFQDMLIQVTSFFRDTQMFHELREKIFPDLLKNGDKQNPTLRLWVAGCATGEEAYSLAMTLQDVLDESVDALNSRPKIQIFASDISTKAIEHAREGIFNHLAVESLTEDMRRKYFTKINSDYRINKSIRDLIVFAPHNFLKDPPFAKIDLLSCRNVFIYMDTFLQKKALTTFHYALKENGYLVLGKAETVGSSTNQFIPVSKHEKIYSRTKGLGRYVPSAPKIKQPPLKSIEPKFSYSDKEPDFRKVADKMLIDRHTPPNVIVDDQMEVVHINGVLSPFLEHHSGKPSFNLNKMAQEGLGFELRNAIHKVRSGKSPVIKKDIPIHTAEENFLVTIEVLALKGTVEPHYLIVFHRKSAASPPSEKIKKLFKGIFKPRKNELQAQNLALRNELAQVREDMGSISEDQEATNEELQSANEELLSSNEEMQSLNEELETSKEELQSTNEELVIINQELVEKQNQIKHQFEYTEAILATLRESLVVLDKDLRLRSGNDAFFKKFEVRENDVLGKSIFTIQQGKWNDDALKNLLSKVLNERAVLKDFDIKLELPKIGYRNFQLNAREIVDGNKSDKLILLAIEDVTERKKAVQKYEESIDELKKTNEQLDQFTNIASHDLQEPLRKILIFSDRLRNSENVTLAPEMVTYVEKMEESAKRMTTLVKNLLDYSRVANHDLLLENTDLNEVLRDLLPDFEVLIEEKNAQIDISPLPTIKSIPHQISQLFYNLINNALKFSNKAIPPKIEISTKELDPKEIELYRGLNEHQKYIEILVKDNGIGFDKKYGEHIFKIFQRLNKPREYQGTGIGLALVKRIVDNHKGLIFADSKEGEGAEFHVILPVDGPVSKNLVL